MLPARPQSFVCAHTDRDAYVVIAAKGVDSRVFTLRMSSPRRYIITVVYTYLTDSVTLVTRRHRPRGPSSTKTRPPFGKPAR